MQIKLNVDFQVVLTAIKKWRHQDTEEGVPKISERKWRRGEWDTCKYWHHQQKKCTS